MRGEVDEITRSLGVWFEPEVRQFTKLLEDLQAVNFGVQINNDVVQQLISQIQPKKKVIERVLDVATEAQLAQTQALSGGNLESRWSKMPS